MNQVIASRLRQPDCHNGFILDGYPRTVAQAKFLEGLLHELNMDAGRVVFHFDISNDDVISRLTRRLQCGQCGRIYSMTSSNEDMLCEKDGTKLFHRSDDDAACIPGRLRLYEQNASDLLRFYRNRGCHRIRANRPPEVVSRELLSILRTECSSKAMLPSRAKVRAATQPSYSV
jgi:adenylate kinase